jgi:type I restriction-modification system DNA methylase subunit
MEEFRCPFCKIKPYKTKRGFTNHLNSKHPGQQIEAPAIIEKVDNLSKYCKYFYNAMRTDGKTNNIAKDILLELILLRKLSENLDLFDLEDKHLLDFNSFALNDFQDADVADKIKTAIVIYSKHSKMSEYFKVDRRSLYLGIKTRTLTDLVWKLKTVNLDIHDDFIGDIFEENITKSSRNMGQFFTPTKLKNVALNCVELKNGDRCIDMCMGSAGFLIHLGEMARAKNINIELHGIELDENVYGVALLNLLMRLHLFADNFKRADSLGFKYSGLFDVIVANPPYGGKYNPPEFLPIKVKRQDNLYLQLMMQLLVEGGQCAAVLPSGFLTSQTDKYPQLRKLLLETCTVKKVYEETSESGFKNTSVQTCIIYFIKKLPDPADKVEFYEILENEEKFIVAPTMAEITEKNFSLIAKRYLQKEKLNEGARYLKLGDVYEKKPPLSENTPRIEGTFNLYGTGQVKGTSKTYDYSGLNCKIAGGGVTKFAAVMLLNEKFKLDPERVFMIKSRHSEITTFYLYVWLWANREKVLDCTFGSGQKNLNFEMFRDLDIPVLPDQPKFFTRFKPIIVDIINNKKNINIAKANLENFLWATKGVIMNTKGAKLMKIKDVIEYIPMRKHDFSKTEKMEEQTEEFKYRFYNASEISEFYVNFCECVEESVIFSKVNRLSMHIAENFTPSSLMRVMRGKNISNKYLYLWIRIIREEVESEFSGAVQKSIRVQDFGELEIWVADIDTKKYFRHLRFLETEISRLREKTEILRESIRDFIDRAATELIDYDSFGKDIDEEN